MKTNYLRCYSDMGSPKRSVLTLDALIKKATDENVDAVALTDVTMYSFQDFISRAKKAKASFKIIPALHLYMVDKINTVTAIPRSLILYAKDNDGLHLLYRIATEAQKHILTLQGLDYPTLTKDILSSLIKEQGHLYAFSGGIEGVLSGFKEIEEEKRTDIERIKADIKRVSDISTALSKYTENTENLKTRQEDLLKISKMSFDSEESMLMSQENPDREKCAELYQKKEAVRKAGEEARTLKVQLKALEKEKKNLLTKLLSLLNTDTLTSDAVHTYIENANTSIKAIEDELSSQGSYEDMVRSEIVFYDSLFGHNYFYVELQNHGALKEKEEMFMLAKMATEMKVPTIATNISFMAEKEDIEKRQFIRSMAENRFVNTTLGDEEKYLRSNDDLFTALTSAITMPYANDAMNQQLLFPANISVTMEKDEHYPKYPCTEYTEETDARFLKIRSFLHLNDREYSKADKLLVVKAMNGLSTHYKAPTQELFARFEKELNIIISMGFSDYFLIVQDFLDIGRRCGHMPLHRLHELSDKMKNMTIDEMNTFINEDQSLPGLTIGPGRGSAAGSVVTFSLGITSIDPLEHGLLFERFLNPKRVSMPDIDSDFSKSDFEYGVRDIVIEYVSKKYGQDGVCGIATPSTLAARAAIKTIARIYGAKKKKDTTYFLKTGEAINRYIPNKPGVMLHDFDEEIRTAFKDDKDALFILDLAESVEGLNVNFGRHACGNIIVGNRDVGAFAPLMMDQDTNQWKIEMNAELAEENKFLKMDFLGLKNLNAITKTLRLIYKNTGKSLDPLTLPEDNNVYKQIFTSGRTNAVFQFESAGMKKMLQRFEPEKFSDLILLVACYRPGPLQYLDGIIERKHGRNAEENAVTRIASYNAALRAIVSPTYYALVYQEQIMEVFRSLAGYDMGGADNVRRAMGHKKMDILTAEKKNFVYGNPEKEITGAIKNGIKEQDALDLFEEMIEFAKYSFNKSHAAAYAKLAYITAYLKFYYPCEFYTSILNFTEFSKYPGLFNEAKDFNVKIHVPDVNLSMEGFTEKDNTIYFGLSGIKGIGGSQAQKIRKKGQTFTDIYDFFLNTEAGNSDIEKLINAGALDDFQYTRNALKTVLPMITESRDLMKKEKKKLQDAQDMLNDLLETGAVSREKYHITTKSLPTKKKLEEKIQKSTENLQKIMESFRTMPILKGQADDLKENLRLEKELLGMYISGSPLDGFLKEKDAVNVSDVTPMNNITMMGILSNIHVVKNKKTQADMAFCTLSDYTGSIDVSIFGNQYQKMKDLLYEDNVVIIKGRSQEDTYNSTDQDSDPKCQLIAWSMEKAQEKRTEYFLFLENGISDYVKYFSEIEKYRAEEGYGHRLNIQLGISGKVILPDFTVTEEIKNNFEVEEL